MKEILDFPEKTGYGKGELVRVQNRLFEMAIAVRDVLESFHIPYMIAYGTLLGAIRHRDFIPWDDDFDFNLFDDTYEVAIEALRANLPKEMFLEDSKTEPHYFHGWAHVKDLGTIATCGKWEQDNAYAHKGLHIDLYRIKKMKGGDVKSYLDNENKEYLERRRQNGLISEAEYMRRKSAMSLSSPVPDIFKDIDGYAMINIYKCKFVPAQIVEPLSSCSFRGSKFACPGSPDKMLRSIYGEYLTLPPYVKRLPSLDKVVFK